MTTPHTTDDADSEVDTATEEFDTEAAWIADVLRGLPAEDAIPGACRGSGPPSTLQWLAETLGVTAATRFLDLGGGLGGPAAWLHQHHSCAPVIAEPMVGALRGARRLFALPGVAVANSLPFPDGSFQAAWALAVVSTAEDRPRTLGELHRVLAPGGHLGLYEYTRTVDQLNDPPAGNDFFTPAELRQALIDADFEVVDDLGADQFAAAPQEWQDRAGRVSRRLADDHSGEPAYEEAQHEQYRFAELLQDGGLTVRVIHARRPHAKPQ